MIGNIIRNSARYVMGIVFTFSGFVKAIDPLGSTYKFQDYFDAFGMDFMSSFALFLAILLSSGELLIGLCLLLRLRMRVTAWALLLFMSFFTVLTLFIAITNPVTDCGCFGDAIILTNWQTFIKNLIFFVPTLVVFLYRNKFTQVFKIYIQWILVVVMAFGTILLSLHCYYNLPFLDFRPYHVGANIPAYMVIPDGKPSDEYETVLVYEKDGVAREFSLDSEEQPWNDSTWHWLETKNILIREGYKPPIHDFTLTSFEGYDITDSVLSNQGYSILVISHDLSKANLKGLEQINEFARAARQNNYHVYGMTSSVSEVVEDINKSIDPDFEFFITDNITLKTMIRSNPGMMLVQDGNVIGKWHYRNIPGEDFFKGSGLSSSLKELRSKKDDYFAFLVIVIIGSLALLINIFRNRQIRS